MIEVSFFSDELGTKDVREQVRLGVEAGATGLEIRGGLWDKDVNTITDDDVKKIQKILREFGARVAVIGSGVGKCDLWKPEEVTLTQTRFRRMCELAHMFGTDIVRVFAFWNPLWRTEKKLYPDMPGVMPQLRAAFEPMVAHAEKKRVYIAFEPEGDTISGNLWQIRQIIDGLGGSEVLTVAWDANNAARTGEVPMPEGYGHIRGRVRHVHVKPDHEMSIRTVANTPVSYREVFETLIRDGYNGPASIEHWGTPENMLAGIRQLRGLLETLNAVKRPA